MIRVLWCYLSIFKGFEKLFYHHFWNDKNSFLFFNPYKYSNNISIFWQLFISSTSISSFNEIIVLIFSDFDNPLSKAFEGLPPHSLLGDSFESPSASPCRYSSIFKISVAEFALRRELWSEETDSTEKLEGEMTLKN